MSLIERHRQMAHSYEEIAGMFDHALLSPALTQAELDAGCRLAVNYGVASVCIMPFGVARCAELLAGSPVKASTVIGFPHGGQAASVKRTEAERALKDGAVELDTVINISRARDGNWRYIREELQPIIELAHEHDGRVKVIFENCYLDDDQKKTLCEICGELQADWVKTSTGFGTSGATLDDVRLMREHSPSEVQVKASGGIRTLDDVLTFRSAGVTRIGASGTAKILDECRRRLRLEPIEV